MFVRLTDQSPYPNTKQTLNAVVDLNLEDISIAESTSLNKQ